MTILQQSRHGQPRVYIWGGDKGTDKIDVSGDVVALTTNKRIDAPCGSFSIVLMPRVGELKTLGKHPFQSALQPSAVYSGNLSYRAISIGMKNDGGIMMGLITRVQETYTFTGNFQRTLTITGEDLGTVLKNDSIIRTLMNRTSELGQKFYQQAIAAMGADSYVGQVFMNGPMVNGMEPFRGNSVANAVDWIVQYCTSMTIPAFASIFGGEGRLADYLDVVTYASTDWNDNRVWSTEPMTYQGNVWGYIYSLIDPDFYEVVIDTVPVINSPGGLLDSVAQPYLMVRPKPFDEKILEWASVEETPGITWEDLKTKTGASNHDIGLEDMLHASFYYGTERALSTYSVTSNYTICGSSESTSSPLGISYPLLDTYSAKRFGVRSLFATLKLLGADPNTKPDPQLIGEMTHRIFNWYRYNPFFENGSIQIAGREEIRVGDPIRLPWRKAPIRAPFLDEDGMRYYCTGVSQSWRSTPDRTGIWTTTLELTRGHNAAMIVALDNLVRLDAPPTNPQHFADSF